jgi:hypothetical protein
MPIKSKSKEPGKKKDEELEDEELEDEEEKAPPRPPLAPGVKYRRILLKLSGEALMGQTGYGIDDATLAQIADELLDVHSLGVEIALVIGGGNIRNGRPERWTTGSRSAPDRRPQASPRRRRGPSRGR